MFSGVVVVEIRPTRSAPVTRTFRVLVRNADSMHEALARGVAAALDLLPVQQRRYHATVLDFQRVDFDTVA